MDPQAPFGTYEQAWRGMFNAGVHVRYHLESADAWAIASLIIACIWTVCLSWRLRNLFSAPQNERTAARFHLGLTAALAVAFLVFSVGHQQSHCRSLDGWRKLQTQYEILWNSGQKANYQEKLNELLIVRESIEEGEPAMYSESLLLRCQKDEERAWQTEEGTK